MTPEHGRDETVIAFYDGVQWQRQGTGVVPSGHGETLIGVSPLDEDTVWAVGGPDLPLVKTTDGGVTWQQVGTEGLVPDDANQVVAVIADSGWVAGDYGTIKRTDDGGQSWTRQTAAFGAWTCGFSAMDMQTAWTVGPSQYGDDGWLLRTTDGQHWKVQKSPVKAGLYGISFVGARRQSRSGADCGSTAICSAPQLLGTSE